MKGLEISEVRLNSLEFTGRIDSEYYRPSHLRAENLITTKGAKPLATLCNFIIGPFGSAFTVENYTDDNTYRYIRGKDVKPMQLAENDNVYMPKADFERLSKYALHTGDVLVSVVGTLGNAALVEKRHLPAIFSCKSTALRTNNIEPRYLVTYLNCMYGQDLLIRKERGAIQKGLNLDDLRSLDVYVAGVSLQSAIVKAHEKSEAERLLSQRKLQEAESSLLQSLGLDAWAPPEALSYVRTSTQAFAAGRFDAEYFHPAKAQALVDLRALSDICVGDLFDSIRELWQPTEAAELAVRNYDLTDALDPFLDPSKAPTAPEEIASTKKRIAAGDLVVSRLRSYLREIAVLLPSDGEIMTVASTEFIALRPRNETTLSAEALLIYLRSRLPQIIFKWSQDGSNHPRFDERELLSLPVPRALIADQATYETAVRQMVTQRQRATRLLDAAKRAVEIAIEDSEASALAYLAAANPPDAAA